MLHATLPDGRSRAHAAAVSASPRSAADDRLGALSQSSTWFRTRDGRRYAWEIAVVIVVKLALLLLLWFAFIKPWVGQATPVASAVQQIYLPDGPSTRHD